MPPTDLRSLIACLAPDLLKGLEDAAAFCSHRKNYTVEIEHLVLKLLAGSNHEAIGFFSKYGLAPEPIMEQIVAAVNIYRTGNERPPVLSDSICDLFREARSHVSNRWSPPQITASVLLGVAFTRPDICNRLQRISSELARVSPSQVNRDLLGSIDRKPEGSEPAKSIPGVLDVIAKLSPSARRSLEHCLIENTKQGAMVSVEQWILKCLQEPQTDLVSILRRHQVDSLRVQSHLRAILPACLPNASHYLDLPFAMTPEFLQILQRAWVLASNTNSTHICSGHIFAALYDFTVVRDRLFTNHSELGKMSPCNLILKEIKEMCPNSVESGANVSCDSMLLIE